MKIGITCYPTYGGSGVVASELGKCLAHKGHEIHFISYSLPFRLFDNANDLIFYHEVDVSEYPLFKYPPYSLALACKMVEVAEEHDLDILHVHYAIPHAASAIQAKQLLADRDIKIVTTLHGTDITVVGKDRSFWKMTKYSIEHSDGVTAVSQYLADRTAMEFQTDYPVRVIPNFIDLERFKRSANCCDRKKLAADNEKIVMHISNFRPVKRIPDIIRVFARIRQSVKARLVLIGDGPDRAPAEKLCRELGVEKYVSFLGKQDNVTRILSLADLFLLLSEEESFGLGALEAMSCRVPVVATRAGGIPEVVTEGVTGFMRDVGDIDSLTAAAVTLLSDDAMLARFRDACRADAERRFSCADVVGQYESYYREVLAG